MRYKILKNTHAKCYPLKAGELLSDEQQQQIPAEMIHELIDAGFLCESGDAGSTFVHEEAKEEEEIIPYDAPDEDEKKPKKQKKGK